MGTAYFHDNILTKDQRKSSHCIFHLVWMNLKQYYFTARESFNVSYLSFLSSLKDRSNWAILFAIASTI